MGWIDRHKDDFSLTKPNLHVNAGYNDPKLTVLNDAERDELIENKLIELGHLLQNKSVANVKEQWQQLVEYPTEGDATTAVWETFSFAITTEPTTNTIEPVTLSLISTTNTTAKVYFTGGNGGIGAKTFYFQYKLSSSANNWRVIDNYSPMVINRDLDDIERFFEFPDLLEATEYDFRLIVTDSDGFTQEAVLISTYTLILLLSIEPTLDLVDRYGDNDGYPGNLFALGFDETNEDVFLQVESATGSLQSYNMNGIDSNFTGYASQEVTGDPNVGIVTNYYGSANAKLRIWRNLKNGFTATLGEAKLQELEVLITSAPIQQEVINITDTYSALKEFNALGSVHFIISNSENNTLESISGNQGVYIEDLTVYNVLNTLILKNYRKSVLEGYLGVGTTLDFSQLPLLDYLHVSGASTSDVVTINAMPNHSNLRGLHFKNIDLSNGMDLSNCSSLIGISIHNGTFDTDKVIDITPCIAFKEIICATNIIPNFVGTLPSSFRGIYLNDSNIDPSLITEAKSLVLCNIFCQLANRGNDDATDTTNHKFSNEANFIYQKTIRFNESYINDTSSGGTTNRDSLENTLGIINSSTSQLMTMRESLDLLEAVGRDWSITILTNNYL